MASDSGMMGGSVSHEYMLLTPAGEDSIAICPECGTLEAFEDYFGTEYEGEKYWEDEDGLN